MRYLLFSGENYYPAGGIDDIKGIFDTVDESISYFKEHIKKDIDVDLWAHIFDLQSMIVIARLNSEGQFIFDNFKESIDNKSGYAYSGTSLFPKCSQS